MSLEMRAVDHQPLRNARLLDQGGEDPAEYPEAAPPDEAVVEGFVGTVANGASFHCRPLRIT